MLKMFNAFQLTVLFAASPFILEWIKNASFYGHTAALWVGTVSYVVGFGGMIFSVYNTFGD